MIPDARTLRRLGWNFVVAVAFLVGAVAANAQITVAPVYKLPGAPGPAFPSAAITQAADGNFYGTTEGGGSSGLGTVFRMTPGGVATVLHSFAGGSDGAKPKAALVEASDGNLYGTTSEGGGTTNGGTLFRVTTGGTLTILHRFVSTTINPTHGWTPHASLIQANDGRLYGTTVHGGVFTSGTIFSLTLDGQFATIHSLGQRGEGQQPKAALLQASNGNLYGTTTIYGGTGAMAFGTVFELTLSGAIRVLHVFTSGGGNPISPEGPLIQGADGELYGTTRNGGAGGVGTVFRVTLGGAFALLHSFASFQAGALDGAHPRAPLIEHEDGAFYGTTSSGGKHASGTIFSISSAGEFSLVHTFTFSNGSQPYAGLTRAADGSFYGTTNAGGDFTGAGMVFRLTSLDVQLLDPVSSYAPEHAVTAGMIAKSKLHLLKQTRKGAATDGRTLLLVRLRPAVTTTFTIGGNGSDGTLLSIDHAIDAVNASGSVTAQPVGDSVWVVYRAPARLGAIGSAPSRDITITATPSGGVATSITVTLERPPVVLVHGAWDDPSVWRTGTPTFEASLKQRGFRNIFFANYKSFHASNWDPKHPLPAAPHGLNSIRILQQTIEHALREMRSRSIAATQADIVAHSTGGVLARALIAQPACGIWTPIHRHGRVQCYLDPTNLSKGWIRHLITVGTPHNGAPIAKFLIENQERLVFLGLSGGPVVAKIKDLMALSDRPIDQGLVEDFIPGSAAYRNLGTSCDRGITVRGYGMVGNHAPTTTSFLFDRLVRYVTGRTIDEYLGEENDLMSGLRSQWGRGSNPGAVPFFKNTVHSPSYLHAGSSALIAEPNHQDIQTQTANLLESDPSGPQFACFQSDLTPFAPAAVQAARETPATDPAGSIRFVAPTDGLVIRQEKASTLTLAIETVGAVAPTGLIFIVGNSLTVAGPDAAPFSVSVPLPAVVPLGPLNIVALALDASTGGLLAASTSVTVMPSGTPVALVTDVSRIVFSSLRHPAVGLQVLASFDRGGGESAVWDVSSAALGTKYQTLNGQSVVNVNADGVVTAVAAGEDRITILNGGLSTTVDVIVEAPHPFSDAALSAGTPVRAVHFSELRERINGLRSVVGLPMFLFMDANLQNATIRARHLTELRDAINDVYEAAGLPTPAFSDPAVSPGTPIRRVHVLELRNSVTALE